jgi:ERCC4-type nuclease
MLVEGSDSNVDRSLEQALVSTSLENGFMIERTTNLAGTARFLDDLTKHLKRRLESENAMVGF